MTTDQIKDVAKGYYSKHNKWPEVGEFQAICAATLNLVVDDAELSERLENLRQVNEVTLENGVVEVL